MFLHGPDCGSDPYMDLYEIDIHCFDCNDPPGALESNRMQHGVVALWV